MLAAVVTELCGEGGQQAAKIVLNLILFMSPVAHAA